MHKCADLVHKVRELLKTIERAIQVPHEACGISTGLNYRREEFDAVLKKLEKMKQRTKRTHPLQRTENFILAQGWAKQMEAIHNNLVHLRNGIETIVATWDVGQFVVTKVVEEIVTFEDAKNKEMGRQIATWNKHQESETAVPATLNYVDRMQMTIVKLTEANKSALNQYGNLQKLSLPDALLEAYWNALDIDETCRIQLLQRSGELHHPGASSCMRFYHKWGLNGLEKNVDSAGSHWHVASSHEDVFSTFELMQHYDQENGNKMKSKYIKMASNLPLDWHNCLRCMLFAIEHGQENTQLLQSFIEANQYAGAFQQSICHFLGFGVPKSSQAAIDAFQSFDSNFYFGYIDHDNLNRLSIMNAYWFWLYERLNNMGSLRITTIRNCLDFLFKSNQFLPFLILSFKNPIYSTKKWKRCALHAANNGCVDAHIFLAEYYANRDRPKECAMKLHLRIAGDAILVNARRVCRQLFEENGSVSKGVWIEEEKRSGNQSNQEYRSHEKQSEKKNKKS